MRLLGMSWLWLSLPALAHGVDPRAIPLGDGKVSAAPRAGYVYSCRTSFRGGGAQHFGDWIQGSSWDETRKIRVQGSVSWPQARLDVEREDDARRIVGNGLPIAATTGTFPVQRSDPAFQIDRNPNAVRPQELAIRLPLAPRFAARPSCVPMGPIGITLSGVLLFNALDDAGRDAVAHEVQDGCNGHPEHQGRYHYHGPSPCVPGMTQPDAVIGFAFDGFPITGTIAADGHEYVNADLDDCHGRTDVLTIDGKAVRSYHYAMTREYPYTVGCFRGQPVQLETAMSTADDRPRMGPPGRPHGPRPPVEAVQACRGKSVQAPCAFTSPRGDEIRGVCGEPAPTVMACMPGRRRF